MGRDPGRNDPCWCGSGLKYKKCHLGRADAKPLPVEAITAEAGRFFRTKQCLHPSASPGTCGKIIEAHTIQRAGGLAGIVDQTGHVLSFYRYDSRASGRPHAVGWREASTFAGFCQRHDGETFRPLEQKPFVGSDEQCFLLAYRAQCHELYQKQASERSHDPIRQLIDRGQPREVQREIQQYQSVFGSGVRKGLEDARTHKARMDAELLGARYSDWERLFVKFEGPLCVVSTGAATPNRNLAGEELQAIHDVTSRLQPLYFGVTPTESGGAVVFLWRPEDEAPRRFMQDLKGLALDALPSALIQFMFAYVENTFFAAGWWNGLSERVQSHLAHLAQMSNPYYLDWAYIPGEFLPWRVTGVATTYATAL